MLDYYTIPTQLKMESHIRGLEMGCYIRERLNHVLNTGKRLYRKGKPCGGFETGFVRKEEWDCEKFDEIINLLATRDEDYLNKHKSGSQFTIKVRMIHDKVHKKDGLSRKYVVVFDWEPISSCPFDAMFNDAMYSTYGGDRTPVQNEYDSDDGE
jgi:hypothetical protein